MRMALMFLLAAAPFSPAADPPPKVTDLGGTGPAVLTGEPTVLPIKPATMAGDVQALDDRGEGMLYVDLFSDAADAARKGGYVVWGEGSKITLDGKPATKADVLAEWKKPYPWLRATLHPRIDRYGASTQAEFVTARGKPAAARKLNGTGEVDISVTGKNDVVEAREMARLTPTGVPKGCLVNWSVSPSDGTDTEQLADGTLTFVGPAGTYKVTCEVVQGQVTDGVVSLTRLAKVSGTITVRKPAAATTAPQQPPAAVAAAPVYTPRRVMKQFCGPNGCYWAEVVE